MGRQTELYTMPGSAHHTQYEAPRAMYGRIFVSVVLAALFAGEIWWYVKYREYQGWIRFAEKPVEEKK